MDAPPVPCRSCAGNGGFKVDSMTLYGIPGGEDWGEMCPVCRGDGTVPSGCMCAYDGEVYDLRGCELHDVDDDTDGRES